MLRRAGVQRRQRGLPEDRSEHGSLLQRQPLVSRQRPQARLQHAAQRGRQGLQGKPVCLQHPVQAFTRHRVQHALVQQHLQQLFHEKWVAVSALHQQRLQRRRRQLKRCQQRLRQQRAVGRRQRQQRHTGVGGVQATRPPLLQRGPRGQQHEGGHAHVACRQAAHVVQAGVVGPVCVVQAQQQWQAAADSHGAQQHGGGVQRALADLCALLRNAAHVRAVAEIEAQQMAQHLRFGHGRFSIQRAVQPGCDAGCEAFSRQRRGVAVGQHQRVADQVAQRGVGHAFLLRTALRLQPQRALRLGQRPRLPLAENAALAKTGVAHQGHGRHGRHWRHWRHGRRGCPRGPAGPAGLIPTFATFAVQLPPGLLQRGNGSFAADQRRLQPCHAALRRRRAVQAALHEPGAQRVCMALDLKRRLLMQFKLPRHQALCGCADAHRAGWRRLLHARGHVDGGAADGAFGVHATAQQHRPGVQAHAHVEARVAVFAPHAVGLQAGFADDEEARQHRVFCIVFAHFVGAESGQQAVARILQHSAVMPIDDVGEARQRGVHHEVDVFRLELAAQRGGTHHIHKQHRHLPQALFRHGAAAQQVDAFAQCRLGQVEHGVVDFAAQALQRQQADLQQLGRHAGFSNARRSNSAAIWSSRSTMASGAAVATGSPWL